MKPDHLEFDPEPCRAGLPQVSRGADPTHSSGGGGLIHPMSPWGYSHQQELRWKVLLLWLQGICPGGTMNLNTKPQLPGILHRGICAFLCPNFFVCGCRAGGGRAGWHSPVAITKYTRLMHRPVLPHLCTCCLLPFAQNLSFRRKIAVHRNFQNALRGHISFLQWYVNSPPWCCQKGGQWGNIPYNPLG